MSLSFPLDFIIVYLRSPSPSASLFQSFTLSLSPFFFFTLSLLMTCGSQLLSAENSSNKSSGTQCVRVFSEVVDRSASWFASTDQQIANRRTITWWRCIIRHAELWGYRKSNLLSFSFSLLNIALFLFRHEKSSRRILPNGIPFWRENCFLDKKYH